MGNFELDLTSHIFYKFITVVSTILLYHMYGRRFILFFDVVRRAGRRSEYKNARGALGLFKKKCGAFHAPAQLEQQRGT